MDYILSQKQHEKIKKHIQSILEKKVDWEHPYKMDSFLILWPKNEVYHHNGFSVPAMEYDSSDKRLLVNSYLYEKLNSWIPIPKKLMEDFFKEYFQNNYNVTIASVVISD
jgi:hypothetical protein